MTKRSFFSFSGPRLEYEKIKGRGIAPFEIRAESKAVLMIEGSYKNAQDALIQVGRKVKTFEKLTLYENSSSYATSPCTGRVVSISPFTGYMGKKYARIEIETAKDEERDESFGSSEKNLRTCASFLSQSAGGLDLSIFLDPEKPIDTIIVSCLDSDLSCITSQYTALTNMAQVKEGVKILKDITGISNIIIAVPKDRIQGYEHSEAKVMKTDACYPAGIPRKILKDLTGKTVPPLKTFQDAGAAFFTAEAAVSLSKAFMTGTIPLEKLVTVTDKQHNKRLVTALVGTPVSDIFKALDIVVNDSDRIIFGGPMTGEAVFSEDTSIRPDTDAVMVQDAQDIYIVSDYFCTNCGDCVRECPANIEVNNLVRLLDAGHYREAAETAGLYSCIDCGLCSYICPAAIPVFQYIQLGKQELIKAEAPDEQ